MALKMYTFKKNERLANHRLQKFLFEKGNQLFQYPIKLQWIVIQRDELPGKSLDGKPSENQRFDYPAKCLIGASKRQLKKAIQRNRAKRLIKEAYRKNKSAFYAFLNTKDIVVLCAFIYTARKMTPYHDVEKSVQAALKQLMESLADFNIDAK